MTDVWDSFALPLDPRGMPFESRTTDRPGPEPNNISITPGISIAGPITIAWSLRSVRNLAHPNSHLGYLSRSFSVFWQRPVNLTLLELRSFNLSG